MKIHYASLGNGPLIVMIHGFPDFWYTWRDQMVALSGSYQCVAIDQRGYNLSDKPKGVENYGMKFLAEDVAAVVKSLGQLANNPQQQKNSQYARNFQQPDAASKVTAEALARRVTEPEAHAKYLEAFQRSDIEAMLNYYKANYRREPYTEDVSPVVKVKTPVLMFHGLDDTALLPGALNNTWDWLEKDLTLVTVPGAGHWVQSDASDLVSRTMKAWLSVH